MPELPNNGDCLICSQPVGEAGRLDFAYGRVRPVVRVATQHPLGKYRDIQHGSVHICQECAGKQIQRENRRVRGLLAGLLVVCAALLLGGFWQPPLWMLLLVILPTGLLYLFPLLRRKWQPANPDDLLILFEREIKASLGFKPPALRLWSEQRYRALNEDTSFKA